MVNNTYLYDILEISPNSTEEEIKSAYRKKAISFHPDKGGDIEIFKKINYAYEILSNKIKRDNYDNFLEDKKFKMQDFMQDLLKKFFKFSNEKIKTEPIIYNYDTTLEELCENKNIKFKFDCKILCDCLKNYENKNYCGKDNCQYGNKIIEKTFDIILNCDIENNHEFIYKNQGNQNIGEEIGDFIIKIKYKKHKIFKLENKNLILKKKISLCDSLCGFSFFVKHPNGDEIEINSTKIINSKDKIIINNKGLDETGDLIIKFYILFPKKIDEKQKNKLRKILCDK